VGSCNDEATRWVKRVDGLLIKGLGRFNRLDHMFHKISRDFLVGDILTVLGGDNNGVLYSQVTWVFPLGRTQSQLIFAYCQISRLSIRTPLNTIGKSILFGKISK
jgi:hypothetical protein